MSQLPVQAQGMVGRMQQSSFWTQALRLRPSTTTSKAQLMLQRCAVFDSLPAPSDQVASTLLHPPFALTSDDNMPETCVTVHFMTSAGQPRNAHGHIPEPESWQKAGVGEGDLLVAKHLFSSMVMVVCMIVHDSCSCLGQPHELSTAPGDGNALRAWQTFQHMDIPIPCRLPT